MKTASNGNAIVYHIGGSSAGSSALLGAFLVHVHLNAAMISFAPFKLVYLYMNLALPRLLKSAASSYLSIPSEVIHRYKTDEIGFVPGLLFGIAAMLSWCYVWPPSFFPAFMF
jgi:hypothetical protein